MLGASVDDESDGVPGTGADGDDLATVDDENGVTGAITATVGQTSIVTVSVTNTRNQPATLAGWFDLDRDGTFEAGERTTASIPANAGTVTRKLTFPTATVDGASYARFRLFPGDVADPSPTGAATAGEVEDHFASVVAGTDYGDAPDTYGTLSGSNGPVHTTTGPRLGALRDDEVNATPNAAATGDDTAGVDDEDGVEFNPALGYPNATIRTGPDPITLEPVGNTLKVTASAAGFASVWVDWNIDGDFNDAGERVTNAQPVTAGTNDVTFSHLDIPQDIRTYVRVRLSTNAAAIAQPTGPAPDGEVEDYRVLVERLVTPAACSPVTEPYYAFTFNSVTEQTGAGAPGTRARYPSAGVVRGEVIDVIAELGSPGSTINPAGFGLNGDDMGWQLNGSGSAVAISFTFVKSGTTTPSRRQHRLDRQRHGRRRTHGLHPGRDGGRLRDHSGQQGHRHLLARRPPHLRGLGHQQRRPREPLPGLVRGQERGPCHLARVRRIRFRDRRGRRPGSAEVVRRLR